MTNTISNTIANQPIASGQTIRPFATVALPNEFFSDLYTATITITDNGAPTDEDGILTGPGLSKGLTPGIYTLDSLTFFANLQGELNQVMFATVAGVPAGQSRQVNIELDVTNPALNVTAKDTTTSLDILGPNGGPPQINGTKASTVQPSNVLDPLYAVTISDANAGMPDSLTITTTDVSGRATDDNGTFGSQRYLAHAAGSGIYTITAADPATLTTEINSLVFTPAPLAAGQTASTTNVELDATNANGTTRDTKTSVTEQVLPTPRTGSNNFKVADETSGQGYQAGGTPYTGPVQGLFGEIILVNPDNLNVTAYEPNVFIKTGSGEDAIDVSGANGTNVLDGSTGSNFLVGGTGNDTFFDDDRNATTDIWSTIKGFHAGSEATVFGISPQDFNLNWVDNQGAAGYTGLTLHATAPGKSTASLTLTGYTSADLANGRLSISFGSESDGSGSYMLIRGN